MSLKCLGVVLLASLVAAEIPSYLKICKRRDPKVDQCVVDAVDALADRMRSGMPEIGVPSIDPLHLKFMTLVDSNTIKIYGHNAEVAGLSDFHTESLHLDFEKRTIHINSVFRHTIFTSEYEVKANIFVPLEGRGHIRVDGEYLHARVVMNYEMVKKNDSEYIHFTSMTTNLTVKSYNTEFKPLEGTNGITLTTVIKLAMQDSHQEILEAILPVVENIISTEVLKLGNAVGARLPFNEFFPDTE